MMSQDENLLGRFMAGSGTARNWLALMKEITTVKNRGRPIREGMGFSLQRLRAALPHTGLSPVHLPHLQLQGSGAQGPQGTQGLPLLLSPSLGIVEKGKEWERAGYTATALPPSHDAI